MYEVKTKKDMEAVKKNLMYNTIQGGSFSAWCQVNKSWFPMYLVIVPRKHTLNRKIQKSEFHESCSYNVTKFDALYFIGVP